MGYVSFQECTPFDMIWHDQPLFTSYGSMWRLYLPTYIYLKIKINIRTTDPWILWVWGPGYVFLFFCFDIPDIYVFPSGPFLMHGVHGLPRRVGALNKCRCHKFRYCRVKKVSSLRIIGASYRGVWICIAGFKDLQTPSFEIPSFLGYVIFIHTPWKFHMDGLESYISFQIWLINLGLGYLYFKFQRCKTNHRWLSVDAVDAFFSFFGFDKRNVYDNYSRHSEIQTAIELRMVSL